MEFIGPWILSSLLAVQSPVSQHSAQWSCTAPQWDSEPTITQNLFRGTLGVRCTFATHTDGDYRRLAKMTTDEITHEAITVHSGPTPEEYHGLPSEGIDATLEVNEEGLQSVRVNIHVAGDGAKHFLYSAESKAIQATGTAANIKRLDELVDVARGKHPGSHELTYKVTTHVQRPFIVSAPTFKNLVMSKMQDKLVAKQEPVISAIAEKM